MHHLRFLNHCRIILLGLFCLARVQAAEPAKVHPAPDGEPLSSRFTVTVDGQNTPVYLATVVSLSAEERIKVREMIDPVGTTGKASFTSFDISGSAAVVVTCAEPIQSVKILPSTCGITQKISGKQLTFSVSKPGPLTLEINGDWVNSLHLFVNPPETKIPSPGDPNVIYYGPGVHEISQVKVSSGQTVYIADGAVLYGSPLAAGKSAGPLFLLSGSNIVLRGRGIIDGSKRPHPDGGSLIVAQGANIQVEGVILRDAPTWNFPVRKSDHVDIRNIKVLGWRSNSDGIDICNSRNVTVSDCFLRTFDDLVVVKSYDLQGGPAQNITVKHCVLWNEFAHALSLGAELRTPVKNVSFSNCDVIHDKGREWLLRIYHCDAAPIKNISFDHIRCEETRRLMSVWIGKAFWSKDDERGHINNVTFRNIQSVIPEQPDPFVELTGFDTDHAIHDVRLKQILIGGKPLQAANVQSNEFVKDVRVSP
jgi:hypothetical protein